ncbi:MAG: hypothetical protein GWN32_20150 [Gemmatimonadetes bacterium]|nr:hypothetical protein [Gemmatimonadota bacterium]
MSEKVIEDRIMRDTGALGYPDAQVIRNVRISPDSGRIDLMILPLRGRKKLALVEVKQARSPDAASKVIRQLIMYYAASLQIGLRGVAQIREFAGDYQKQARSTGNTSINRLAGGASSQEAGWRLLQEGRPLKPSEIDLFLALNREPQPKLVNSLSLLKKSHGLRIRLVVASGRGVRLGPAV